MTYEEIVASILELPKFTKKNRPSHTREFMERLGSPQDCFPVIHVAGSNGKGSVCAFLGSVLTEAGIKNGMFTSPHLTDIRERFRINGGLCTREAFLEAEQQVREAVEKMQQEGMAHPTFFEYMFGIGMVLFQKAGVSCAVVETGLGGRLDATNVTEHPMLTIITSISLEHTEILGDTIEKIAAEKAGIIKTGVPVLYDSSQAQAARVIAETARRKAAPAEEISPDIIKILLSDGKTIDFSLDCRYDVTRVRIPFPAEYQTRNAALALAAVQRLKERFPIENAAIEQGFLKVSWPGRMEEILPEVYLEGAHNTAGIQAFLDAAEKLADTPSILLISMVKEKSYKEAVSLLCRRGSWDTVILTKISNNPRALEPDCLKKQFEEETGNKIRILTIENPEEAFWEANACKRKGQKLFCIGSLYLIGELKKIAGGVTDD